MTGRQTETTVERTEGPISPWAVHDGGAAEAGATRSGVDGRGRARPRRRVLLLRGQHQLPPMESILQSCMRQESWREELEWSGLDRILQAGQDPLELGGDAGGGGGGRGGGRSEERRVGKECLL